MSAAPEMMEEIILFSQSSMHNNHSMIMYWKEVELHVKYCPLFAGDNQVSPDSSLGTTAQMLTSVLLCCSADRMTKSSNH